MLATLSDESPDLREDSVRGLVFVRTPFSRCSGLSEACSCQDAFLPGECIVIHIFVVMRPPVLYPLFAPLTSLSGVGVRRGRLLARLNGERILDLCRHLPVGLRDRRYSPPLEHAESGRYATLRVLLGAHRRASSPRAPYKISARGHGGEVDLVFFRLPDYLRRRLSEGETCVVGGRLEQFEGRWQMVHPDRIGAEKDFEKLRRVEPLYEGCTGLTQQAIMHAIQSALEAVPDLPEWVDGDLLRQESWPDWKTASRMVHAPRTPSSLSPTHPARRRLAYDELLAGQLAFALARRAGLRSGRSICGNGKLEEAIRTTLPFSLTSGQESALREIYADMGNERRMLRLLQGDVGSGKTAVAILSAARALEEGLQVAFLAPTEILARQHWKTLQAFRDVTGFTSALLTGQSARRTRGDVVEKLASGAPILAIGTHALLSKDLVFGKLGLAIIDEQHRFGVRQRILLLRKGERTDTLLLSATPIPRSLFLAHYGDLQVSTLRDKPPGRKPVHTSVLSAERLEEVLRGLERLLERGEKVFWVCPRIGAGTYAAGDLSGDDRDAGRYRSVDAQSRFRVLARHFSGRVALVHGQMSPSSRTRALEDFSSGRVQILVATTVIEVGLDIPSASAVVIEHAERFGLAQLHQLRGRVGRSDREGFCVLLYHPPLSPTAEERLRALRTSFDGFALAERDLALRGSGEMLGVRQSGSPDFHLVDMQAHRDLVARAHRDACVVSSEFLASDSRADALRILLYLFSREAVVPFLCAG